jgi:hypothetical protein
MILDMIQGCRYLRRSTDRWLLSKNLTTRLKDSKVGVRPVLLWNCSIPITNIKGLYLYPCPNTTPDRLRVQHLIPKLMLWCQCPSRTVINSSLPYIRAMSSRIPKNFLFKHKQFFCRMMAYCRPQASSPNPLRRFSCQMAFRYQTRPTSQSLSCTNFWC